MEDVDIEGHRPYYGLRTLELFKMEFMYQQGMK
jgi:hypothetical protein